MCSDAMTLAEIWEKERKHVLVQHTESKAIYLLKEANEKVAILSCPIQGMANFIANVRQWKIYKDK